MSLWTKLNTLFRASAEEPLHHLVDANSIRIFEQEIRDGQKAIQQAKLQLATVMAEKKQLQRHNQALQENISNKERQACAALDQEAQTLARDVAELIAEDEHLLQQQTQQVAQLEKQEAHLKRQLRTAATSMQKYQRELTLAKANRSAQQAVGNLNGHSRGLSACMQEMASSLDKIKGQQTRAAEMDDALREIDAELNGEQLDARLKQAGIASGEHDADKVLERLRKQRAA